ncbi:low affinity iron permease family protein [Pseudomonas entomophila]|uniref:low affinity iron permease family protein n=1 Tax=Pseudomonas entomophila TaxID=312306 RepID=UPI0015E36760|nr:low affinity iron permease family protein [Pseudomonas entomophila]MBA1192764.1 low affinity iron permease family protein [Pseudomonas entomophila]
MGFSKFCKWLSDRAGSPRTFLLALALIISWASTGPWFHYNETWQLVINTSTTIITFLMVFLIQNTQNRDNDILHIKLDELIRTTELAKNSMLDLEGLGSKELHELRQEYRELGKGCRSTEQLKQDKG